VAGRAAALRGSDHGDLRAHLVAAAQRLVARRGTAGVTVREIAAEAGVAVGVLYNHFQDKDELLALGLHAHCRGVEAALGPPPGPPGSAGLFVLLRGYVQRAIDFHLAVLPAFAGVMAEPGLAARFTALPNPTADGLGLRGELAGFLRGEQALGRLAPDADVEVAATIVIGACHELLLPRLHEQPRQHGEQLLRHKAPRQHEGSAPHRGSPQHGSSRQRETAAQDQAPGWGGITDLHGTPRRSLPDDFAGKVTAMLLSGIAAAVAGTEQPRPGELGEGVRHDRGKVT
jgi:AcrR family transcriptional regulator